MKVCTEKVTGVTRGNDSTREGDSFHLRVADDPEIWVKVRGKLPSFVQEGAIVIVEGDWSHAVGNNKIELFAASKVSCAENPEPQDTQ